MTLTETPLQGAFLIEQDRRSDDRGYFARTYSQREFEAHGIGFTITQSSTSFNRRRGTLRGLHYQVPPAAEAKLVRCVRGAIYDVIVDLRPASATRFCWYAAELTEDNGRLIFVPEGFAHGFQTLRDATEVAYEMSGYYSPDDERGVRWDDPHLRIKWPDRSPTLSPRDASLRLIDDKSDPL